MKSSLDGWVERHARRLARRIDRRSFLARLGALIAGGVAVPLLPIARGFAAAPSPAPESIAGPEGDPTRC